MCVYLELFFVCLDIARHCEEVKTRHLGTGYYQIDLDGTGSLPPFKVFYYLLQTLFVQIRS